MTASLARAPRQLDIIADTALRADARLHSASSSVAALAKHSASSSLPSPVKHSASSSVHALVMASELSRQRRGMSHPEFCRLVGLEINNWHKLRRGQSPSAATLRKLEAAESAPAREARPPQIVKAFHRLVMQLIAARMDFDVATLLATDFSKQRPGLPQWLRAARIRQMAIYITAVELEVSNADLGRALGVTRANIKFARDAIEDRRDDGNEIDVVLTAVSEQVRGS